MALTNWNDILNKPKGIDEVPEIALTVKQLSASVLSISEDVEEIAGDVQEIALDISQLSASNLPYSATQSTKQAIDETATCILLAELTAADTEYSLSQSVSNFKQIIAEVYFVGGAGPTRYILGSIVLPVAEWAAGRNVIPCYNDGTLRKAQFNIVSNTSVKTAPLPNFVDVSGVNIYGVK